MATFQGWPFPWHRDVYAPSDHQLINQIIKKQAKARRSKQGRKEGRRRSRVRTSSAALEWKARRAAAIILVAANDMGIERIYSSCPSWLGLGFHKLSLSLSLALLPPLLPTKKGINPNPGRDEKEKAQPTDKIQKRFPRERKERKKKQ